jgi:hypothetical protein
MRKGVVMLVGLGCAGCGLAPEPNEWVEPRGSVSQAPSTAEEATEPVGVAVENVTRADCIESWRHNLDLCNTSPPNLRPACFAACSAFLAGCLAVAQG